MRRKWPLGAFFAVVMVLLGIDSAPVIAAEISGAHSASGKEKFQKVGGDYKVTKIERDEGGLFRIEFEALRPTGRFDILRLESHHVHVGVKIGQTLRLSAEVMSENGVYSDVSQVVLFLPGRSGRTPVWLLSKKAMGIDLKAIRYLEMHVPANDFVVM